MNTTDPIADLLTRIRNAIARKHESVTAPYSNQKKEIARILKESGYIKNYSIVKDNLHKNISIELRYDESGESVITKLQKISKPGLRVYSNRNKLPIVLNGAGIAVVSTSKGVMSVKDAKMKNLGGEIICTVY